MRNLCACSPRTLKLIENFRNSLTLIGSSAGHPRRRWSCREISKGACGGATSPRFAANAVPLKHGTEDYNYAHRYCGNSAANSRQIRSQACNATPTSANRNTPPPRPRRPGEPWTPPVRLTSSPTNPPSWTPCRHRPSAGLRAGPPAPAHPHSHGAGASLPHGIPGARPRAQPPYAHAHTHTHALNHATGTGTGTGTTSPST